MHPLERQLRDDPDDWDAWRVFGDWLTERGDPRGPLVGLEHRLRTEPMPAAVRAPLVGELQQRHLEVQNAWLAQQGRLSGVRLAWRAGFVLGVELWTWWGGADELGFLEALPADPAGALFQRLRLKSHCGLTGFRTLAESPALTAVRELVLSEVGMDASMYDGVPGRHGLDLFVRSPHLQQLRHLDVSRNSLDPSSRAGVTSSSGTPPVTGDYTDDKGALLATLADLEVLNVGHCDLGDDQVGSLVSGALSPIALDLTANGITEVGARLLAGSHRLARLKTLILRDNPLDRAGIDKIVSSRRLSALERLDLSFTLGGGGRPAAPGTADPIARVLAAAPALAGLKELDLRGNGLSDEGLAVLTGSDTLRDCLVLR
ncbi:MAG: hypothetical protein R3F59_19070 [Myxococcota bacterium]